MNFSQLMNLAAGHVEARIVQTAAELRIFDVLDSEPLGAEAVAARLVLDTAATELLLNALVALNLLEKQHYAFSLAPIARQFLRTKLRPISRRNDPFRIVTLALLGAVAASDSFRQGDAAGQHDNWIHRKPRFLSRR